uniref:Uncharacterized protein n=1 Tax=Arundo donax TaxID=35708 RepID=A0A0A9FME4_ARUDO
MKHAIIYVCRSCICRFIRLGLSMGRTYLNA